MMFLRKIIIVLSFGILVSSCNTVKPAIINDFTVSMNSPQNEVGEIDMQLDTLMGLGPIKKQTVSVLYFPKEDAVCLRYKYDLHTYNQFWDNKGRARFINALKNYNEDYDSRNLQPKSKKSQEKYGTVRSYIVWQQLAILVQAYSNTDIKLGYTFKDKSPYFSVYQCTAEYIDKNAGDSNIVNIISPDIVMFFTRAQASALAEIFEQYIIPDSDLPDEQKESVVPPKKNAVPRDEY